MRISNDFLRTGECATMTTGLQVRKGALGPLAINGSTGNYL